MPTTRSTRSTKGAEEKTQGKDKTKDTVAKKEQNGTEKGENGDTKQEENTKDDKNEDEEDASKGTTTNGNTEESRKRKADSPAPASKEEEPATKAARKTSSNDTNSVVKMINYLLSDDALVHCRPKDEVDELKEKGEMRTYLGSPFNPFEELVCALILSRPIGHMLGMRSIRTIFNAPYNLTTPHAIRTAGYDGCREALDAARTQHRQKTAEELVGLADAVCEHLGQDDKDTSLQRVRDACDDNVDQERAMFQKHIKGVGKMGLDIFERRVQGQWGEWYPFADERTLHSLRDLGLGSGETTTEVVDLIAKHWANIDQKPLDGGDEAAKKRQVLVRISDRAVAAGLEGHTDNVKAAV